VIPPQALTTIYICAMALVSLLVKAFLKGAGMRTTSALITADATVVL